MYGNVHTEKGWLIMERVKNIMNEDNISDLKTSMNEQLQEKDRFKAYNKYVDGVTPKHSVVKNVIRAFITGGIICLYGHVIMCTAKSVFGLDKETSAICCSIILILTSVILTGLGIYKKIARWGGAGALVPITGFANSITAPAVEFKVEGQVYGIGCKIFTIAGPVILYGLCTSWILGLFYWMLGSM